MANVDLYSQNSAGAISGFELTENLDGSVDIASGVALLRSSNSDTGTLNLYMIPASIGLLMTNEENNFILVDYNGGSPTITTTINSSLINTRTNSLMYVVSRVGTTLHSLFLGFQNVDANGKLRRRFIITENFQRAFGAVLSFTNLNIAVSAGVFFSGLQPINTDAFNTGLGDTFTQVYFNGTNWVRSASASNINNTQYNNVGVLTTMANNRYRTDFVYVIANNPDQLFVRLGETQHTSLASAQSETIPTNIPSELRILGILVGKVVIKKDDLSISSSLSPFTTTFSSGSPTVHNDLAGLNIGDYQHLTVVEKATITPVSNATTVALTQANLDSAYPSATIGFRVYALSIIAGALIYNKTATGWYSQVATLVV